MNTFKSETEKQADFHHL